MLIKHVKKERTPFDLHEWNDEIKAFVKPLTTFEALVFNDYAREFFDKEKSCEERFEAAFQAAKMVLVDEDGAPLLTDDDVDAVKYADFAPIFRVFSAVLTDTVPQDGEAETAKKN
ncbi:MAG: hypothetical protein ACOX0A_01755 [Thermoguttaceae bacterium]|jgi:hypothetical protein